MCAGDLPSMTVRVRVSPVHPEQVLPSHGGTGQQGARWFCTYRMGCLGIELLTRWWEAHWGPKECCLRAPPHWIGDTKGMFSEGP